MPRRRTPSPLPLSPSYDDDPLILLTPPAIGDSPASTYSIMSLVASRHMDDRPSQSGLGSITCSSCAAQIPLDDLGSHVCRPPSRNDQTTRPKLMIPPPVAGPSSAGSSFRGPGSYHSDRSTSPLPRSISPLPPFASSGIARPSPSMLQVPGSGPQSAQNSPNGLPGWPGLSPSAATPSPAPSPTNPFFPSSTRASPQPGGTVVHGLGLGVGSSGRRGEGPYPTDRPLPIELQVSDPTGSGGASNMAGVGRRAFHAAALTVRAGVAIGNNVRQPPQQPPQQASQAFRPPPQHSQTAPMDVRPTAPFAQQSGPRSASPLERPPQAPWNQTPSASPAKSEPAMPAAGRSQSPVMRNPILPKVPLSGRQRSDTQSAGSGPSRPELQRGQTMPASPKQRSGPSHEQRNGYPSPKRAATSIDRAHRRPPVHTQPDPSPSLSASPNPDDNIATLLKARNNNHARKQSNGGAFFDRYKQMSDNARSSTESKGIDLRRGSETSDHLVASPEQTTFSLDDISDDEDSALPWAKPSKTSQQSEQQPENSKRQQVKSIGSGSSSQSGWQGPPSGPESEEVITPSHSWEGLADRANGRDPNGRMKGGDTSNDRYDRGAHGLNDIGEEDEDEGDRVVFGQDPPTPRRRSNGFGAARIHNSASSSTIKASISAARRPPLAADTGEPHSRSRTAPDLHLDRPESRQTDRTSHDRSATSGSSRGKTCQKCGDSVGGPKRFVERDGVVLCEKDWKKLYLPSCRRCNLPIEKSAVSSSDGQLKGKWHRACFSCTKCHQAFEGDSFYVLGGKPWCQFHYHEENGTLCASAFCRRPIEGQCVLTTGSKPQRFHPGHLRCDHRSVCREPMEEYYEVEGKRYCERHVAQYTRKTAEGKDIRAEKRRTRMVDLPRGGLGF